MPAPRPLGINKVNPSSMVVKTEGLHFYRRGSEVLIIEKESASWVVLTGVEMEFFNAIRGPQTVRDYLHAPPEVLTADQKEDLLLRLYQGNMISLDGGLYHDTATLWHLPKKYPTFLCFHMTGACNMKCDYCYARAESPQQDHGVMPREVAHKIVKKIIEDIPARHLLIDFHGGEPFLVFDDMVDTIEYAHEYNKKRGINKKLKFTIQANGLLLTVEKARMLKDLGADLGISIDGPAEIHDRRRVREGRKPTFETIWKNFKAVKDAGLHIGPLAVVHKPDNYEKVFEFFVNNNLKGFRINYSAYIGRAIEELEFPYGRGETFARHYLEMVDKAFEYVRTTGIRLNVQDLNNYLNNIMSKRRPFMCQRSPCGCGNSILGFGKDGGIFACEEAVDVEAFKVGSIFDPRPLTEILDSSEQLKIIKSRTVDNVPRCRTCPIKRFCGGRCTTKSYARFGNFLREDPMCRFYQVIYPEIIWRVHDHPDEAKLLNTYLRSGQRRKRDESPPWD